MDVPGPQWRADVRTIRDAASKNKRGVARGCCATQRPYVERKLLSNIEYERVVIAACAIDPRLIEGLQVEDFTELETRLVYRALRCAGPKFLDRLEAWNEGKASLYLWIAETVENYWTSPLLLDWYIGKLREARTRRELIHSASEIKNLAYETWRPIEDVLRESKMLILKTKVPK